MQTMFSLIKLESRVVDRIDAPILDVSPPNSQISFRDITFAYIPGKPILRSLSFDVPSGKKVALVGGSGSGKSTIVRLLYRLCDPQSGQIRINGQDIAAVKLDSLRRAIAIVPQDSVLFHDTILYNIHYGDSAAPVEKVFEVAKTADLHNAILGMPAGYDTIVGERGLKLSGGEKQRVAIARAILKDAPIIVYDEATSSLDAITEENIMRSLKKAFSGRTSLFIAHRLATIVDADIIYVLDRGMVVESGTHSQLVGLPGGKYADLWHSQHRIGAELELAQREAERQKKREEEEVMLDMELSEGKCCGGMTCNR
ncbi:hypothetical protein niasHS_017414 [Heterodera schachtii]|uniref:Iron-sulfur clusters transporter ABCB7, mitochondrial n=2 Tax=Heterodera TaxID=34509 RepID=A0ABD2I3J6_HETSC